ncbi:MAG: hypothetical protein MUP49_03030 [Dehalococcoidia bacterium]|nr:hypothetical protein [Dehalococcoidia bacterium]
MKRTGLRIMLALVIALTLGIGSVSTVTSAPPSPTLYITITHKEAGNLSFDYGWSGKAGVYSYFVGVYHNTVNPLPHYQWSSGGTFTRRTTNQSLSQNLTSITEDGNYRINLAVYNRKGDGIGFISVTFSLP